MRQRRLYILLAAVFCLAAFSAAAQQGPTVASDKDNSSQSKSSTSKSKGKPTLADATRISTGDAARTAAKDMAKRRGSDSAAEASGAPDVLEFHPDGPGAQGAAAASSRESKKSALKNVHGDAYGALDSRGSGRRAGGSVGATSKSGKSSIYVETDRSRETTPAPH